MGRGEYPEPKQSLLGLESVELRNLRIHELTTRSHYGGDVIWNDDLVHQIFVDEFAMSILAKPIYKTQTKDVVYWLHTQDGQYSVKSGYGVIFADYMDRRRTHKDKVRISEDARNFCNKTLWGLPGPQSWKILLWRILTDTLSVGYNFMQRNIALDPKCKLCKMDVLVMETMEHLFRDCPVSRRLWASSEIGIRTNMDSHLSIEKWIIGWLIVLLRGIKRKLKWVVPLPPRRSWRVIYGFVKVNLSVLLEREGYIAGVGWVTLYAKGEQLMTAEKRIKAESVAQEESLGVRLVLRWAQEQGIRHLQISTNCFCLVSQLAGVERPNHQLQAILADINSYFSFFHCLTISYIPRSFNNVAHSLACKAMIS
ncbi:uncharacterized protein LOC141649608 [Silene latifolia]|uniref:uncharacterized protein LOC141649608 n=1 Tax=Silene latifolia TaxID=37657 RepID=UPI003D7856BE